MERIHGNAGVSAVHPALSSFSTSIHPGDQPCQCAAGTMRMLYAVNGGCSLYASGRKFPLIGPRMAFLTGPLSYQLTEVSPGLTLSSVDLVLKPGECFHWGCREMENAYQQLSSLILPSGRCESFCDSGATVTATVVSHGRHDKVKIFKMRRRKHYQKHQGHRQNYTELRIEAISA